MSFSLALPIGIAGYLCLPLAWWLHRRGSNGFALGALMLAAFLLRLGPALDPGLHEWDERYHALVAKRLMERPLEPTIYPDARLPHDEGSWVSGHIWLNKPPVPLWCMAIAMKCFGTSPWAARMPSVLLSALAVALLDGIGRTLFTRTVAFWSGMLFAINGHLIELASGRTSNDHPDAFLLVLVLAAVFAAVHMARAGAIPWALASGGLLGLAFLSKSWPALIVLPVTALLLIPSSLTRPRCALLLLSVLVAALAVVLPWTVHTWTAHPEVATAASQAHWHHFTTDLEAHGRPWTYYWAQLPMLHGELAPLALLLFLAGPFRADPRRYMAVVTWWLVPYLVFSFAVTKMPGYTAIAAPALCLLLALMIERWTDVIPRRGPIAWACGALLVLLPFRFSVDRVRPWSEPTERYTLAPTWASVSPNTVVTDCPHAIELMFHTPVVAAYAHRLEPEAMERLRVAGYHVVPFSTPLLAIEAER